MLTITFKNVGAGDSIILEWIGENSELRIGIIDCHRYNTVNPVVEHLKELNPKQIDFLVLSHPHKDHYSGLLDLLKYCEEKGLEIKTFLHTMTVHPDYLSLAEDEEEDVRLLEEIMRKCAQLNDQELIKRAGGVEVNYEMTMSHNLVLRCLSPTDIEKRRFTSQIDYFKSQNNLHKCSRAANHLSTIFLVYSEDWSILITSDATMLTFDRLTNRESEILNKRKLRLGQIPHHGSKNNHNPTFWESLNYDINCPAVISAGLGKHKLPDFEVVKDFTEKNYKTYITNLVHGAKRFYDEYTREDMDLEKALDDDSELVDDEMPIEGDQKFEITKKGITYLTNN